jgi:Uma2 family endonuclease
MALETPTPAIERTNFPELVFRSLNANWNYARWSLIPEDGNRYEVINGVLYMTTAPSFFHQWIIRQICLALIEQIDRQGIGLTTWSPIGLLMPGCDPVQPDIVVVRTEDRGMIYDRRINGTPALIVEVLSPSNAEKDTDIKRAAYARAGLPEYWIIRPIERDLIICTIPDTIRGIYLQETIIAPTDTFSSATLPFNATIAEFFAGSPDETL